MWALFIPLRWMQKRLWSRLHRGNHFFNLQSQLLLLRHHWRLKHPPLWVPSHEILVRFLQSGEWLPTPVFWPGDFRGLYSLWGHKESDMTKQVSLYFLQGQAATMSPWPPTEQCHPGPRYKQVEDRWRLALLKTKDSRQLIIHFHLEESGLPEQRESAKPASCFARHSCHFLKREACNFMERNKWISNPRSHLYVQFSLLLKWKENGTKMKLCK